MPLKLIPPSAKYKVFRVRGTHRGVYLDKSTGIAVRARAEALRKKWELDIERGELDGKKPLTFAEATIAFVQAGGEKRFLKRITHHFGPSIAAKDIDQAAIDEAATKLYPQGEPATRNRQVYAPISAILRHNGINIDLQRPKGAAGKRRTLWLRPDEFERVAAAAQQIDPELATMMVLMAYTGMRLGEALALECKDISLGDSEIILHRTKNGDPRLVHLPPRVLAALANHPRGIDAETRAKIKNPRLRSTRAFRFTKNQALNDKAHAVYTAAGVDPGDAPFHILRHTWATWMVRAGADLVSTRAWRSATSARGYTHFVTSEESRKADALPGALVALPVQNSSSTAQVIDNIE